MKAFFFWFIFLVCFLIFIPTPVKAIETCPAFSTTPNYADWTSGTKNVENITIGAKSEMKEVRFIANDTTLYAWHQYGSDIWSLNKTEGVFSSSFGSKSSDGKISFKPFDPQNNLTKEGSHKIILNDNKNSSNIGQVCETSYVVKAHQTPACSLTDVNHIGSYEPRSFVRIEGSFWLKDPKGARNGNYQNKDIDIRLYNSQGTPQTQPNGQMQTDDKTDSNGNFLTTLQIPSIVNTSDFGFWTITASPNGVDAFNDQCFRKTIYVSRTAGENPPQNIPTPSPYSNPYAYNPSSSNPENGPTPTDPCPEEKCQTALGSIDVSNIASLIARLFSVITAIAGAGAIILLIVGGYRVIISRGDKEKLQNGRETITSALIGLIFIILSFVILQIIGIEILHIPQFTQ